MSQSHSFIVMSSVVGGGGEGEGGGGGRGGGKIHVGRVKEWRRENERVERGGGREGSISRKK